MFYFKEKNGCGIGVTSNQNIPEDNIIWITEEEFLAEVARLAAQEQPEEEVNE